MKNILIFILLFFSFNSIASSKETTFTNEIFEKSQLDGKTVVIHSWNKTCVTCARQVEILDQAKKDFKDVIFLSFEQTKDKKIAQFLGQQSLFIETIKKSLVLLDKLIKMNFTLKLDPFNNYQEYLKNYLCFIKI